MLRFSLNNATPQWGDAKSQWVTAVCESAGKQIARAVDTAESIEIILSQDKTDHPRTLYALGPRGEWQVKLNADNKEWCKYAYQFGHEFTHVLLNSRARPYRQTATGYHKQHWLEECICEAASIYSIERMATEWASSPPFPQWRSFASHLSSYALNLRAKSRFVMSKDWYQSNSFRLTSEGPDASRDLYKDLAPAIADVFGRTPEAWEDVRVLNAGGVDDSESIQKFLDSWQKRASYVSGGKLIAGMRDLIQI